MEALERLEARHVMMGPLVTIREDTPLKDAARTLIEQRFSGAPVVDEMGCPVGVISLKDIARYMEWHLEVEETEEKSATVASSDEGRPVRRVRRRRTKDPSVRVVMTPEVRTVAADAPLPEVIDALLEGPYRRIFATGPDGEIVGVISAHDVLRALARELGG